MSRERVYFHRVSSATMALAAALRGDIKLFDAIVSAAEVDTRALAIFYSHADHLIGQSLYLIYEVVDGGDIAMLRHLVENHGFSLTIREEHERDVRESEARSERMLQSTEQGRKIAAAISGGGESYIRHRLRTPYCADTPLQYAELLWQKSGSELGKLLQQMRQTKGERRKLSERIGRRKADPAKLAAYAERFATLPIHQPKRVPLYDLVMKKESCVQRYQHLKEKQTKLIQFRKGLQNCLEYLRSKAGQPTPSSVSA